jgi:hypothetical protein
MSASSTTDWSPASRRSVATFRRSLAAHRVGEVKGLQRLTNGKWAMDVRMVTFLRLLAASSSENTCSRKSL